MFEDESLVNFYAKVCDIFKSYLLLVKRFLNPNLFEKLSGLFLTGLAKVTTIEVSKNLDTMIVDELMGSLKTFELNLA